MMVDVLTVDGHTHTHTLFPSELFVLFFYPFYSAVEIPVYISHVCRYLYIVCSECSKFTKILDVCGPASETSQRLYKTEV